MRESVSNECTALDVILQRYPKALTDVLEALSFACENAGNYTAEADRIEAECLRGGLPPPVGLKQFVLELLADAECFVAWVQMLQEGAVPN